MPLDGVDIGEGRVADASSRLAVVQYFSDPLPQRRMVWNQRIARAPTPSRCQPIHVATSEGRFLVFANRESWLISRSLY